MNEHKIINALKLLFAYVLYFAGLLPLLLRVFIKKGLYIFNYHSFNTFTNDYHESGSLFDSRYEKNFERQLEFYLKYLEKIRVDGLSSFNRNKKCFFLTFDDGYRDNYLIAFPLLKKYSIPAIFFISTGVIGTSSMLWHDQVRLFYEGMIGRAKSSAIRIKKQSKRKLDELKNSDIEKFRRDLKEISNRLSVPSRLMMNWEEIKELHDFGFVIAPHTNSHFVLSKLDRKTQEAEIKKSMEILSSQLNSPPARDFCLPDGKIGSFNAATIELLKENGIKNVYLTELGINRKACLQSDKEPYLLKRIGINPSDAVPLIMLKIIRANLRKWSYDRHKGLAKDI
jgi:peptidoglycan/xylan/chitin deacetylase (PgdA/CDA1 family)